MRHAPRSARAHAEEINGLWVNFDDPDFALVQVSATYAVPLLAPRRD